ncbi:MAG: hypothetical protein H0U75_04700 [Legionella sp.]|nr:hypothetical protein [Legionella sp.]
MPFNQSNLLTWFRKKDKPNELSIPIRHDELWGIIISYAYTYSNERIQFCNFFHLKSMNQLNVQFKKKSKTFIQQAQVFAEIRRIKAQQIEHSNKGVKDISAVNRLRNKTYDEDIISKCKTLEGDDAFGMISEIKHLLEDLPICIDTKINSKKGWNDRFSLIPFRDIRIHHGEEAYFLLVISVLALAIALLVCFAPLVFQLTIVVIILLEAMGAMVSFTSTLALLSFFVAFDVRGPERFMENNFAAFCPTLVENFDEIQQLITDIQVVEVTSKPIEEKIAHPLTKLDKKTACIYDVRRALQTELTFFNTLYQAPSQQVLQDAMGLN